MGRGDPVLQYKVNMKGLAEGMARVSKMLHKHTMGWLKRRPVIVLPTWKWWEIRKHLKADWGRYKRSREAKKRHGDYKWVSKPLRRDDDFC